MRSVRRPLSILLALPALASCAIGGGDDNLGKIDDPLTLTPATQVAAEGVLTFNAIAFAESPTTLLEKGDFHGYEFHGKAGGVVTITMNAQSCGQLDTVLHLFGPENDAGNRGSDLATSDDSGGSPCSNDSQINRFTLPVDGEYLIVATSFLQRGGGHYALKLTCDNGACEIPGEMTFARSRIAQADIDRGMVSAEALFDTGDFLFEHIFRIDEGLGNALAGAPAGPGPLPNFRTVHQGGFGAPEAESCITCHNVGGDDGAGDLNHNIFQIGDGISKASGLQRNAPVVLGLGLRQQIGIEMTSELQAQLAAAKSQAASSGTTVTRTLTAKGISFGSISASPNGTVDTSAVAGVDADLVVKPFGWKGREATLRRFVEGGFRVHFGMQSGPSIAKHCATPDPSTFGTGSNCRDPDADLITDEVTEGQLTAMAVYMALRETPVRVPLTNDTTRNRASAGEQLFGSVGCGSCHTARMRLASPIHVEPADTTGGAGITLDLSRDMHDPHPARSSDGSTSVELWSDFKRHDMGSALADSKPFKTIPPSHFITTPLWGVATSAPYMHDGRAPTLRSAIVAHGGEASSSQAAFTALSTDDQEKLIEFLGTLGREESVATPRVDGVDLSGFVVTQANSTATFTVPPGTIVPHGGYMVIARDATRSQFETFYGKALAANVTFVNTTNKFPLINGSETFSLSNAQHDLVEGPTPAQANSGLQIFQRTSGAAPADSRASWTVEAARPQGATPGGGQASTGNGRIYLSEIADASGSGNSGFEFVELFVE